MSAEAGLALDLAANKTNRSMASPHTRTEPPELSPSQVCAQTAPHMTAQHTHHCAAQGQHASTSARLNDMHTRGQYIPPPYSIYMLDTERRAVLVHVFVCVHVVGCVHVTPCSQTQVAKDIVEYAPQGTHPIITRVILLKYVWMSCVMMGVM
jgi:hypothetical protein